MDESELMSTAVRIAITKVRILIRFAKGPAAFAMLIGFTTCVCTEGQRNASI
jgi:hypothetical protein